ncbi:MAG: putative metabolite transport protein CsbC [Candidatus Anoxychlamydiales bacterium]|nr:putative metabolite transport protein CsbC [Candidatus Anoxychlamydiales bacterium]
MFLSFKNKHFLNALIYTIIACMGGVLFGYHTSAISAAMLFINKSFLLSNIQISFLVSLIILGALFGSIMGGAIADKFGRKKAFFIALILMFYGTVSFIFSKTINNLFIYRFIVGISIGLFSSIVPIYIAEISTSKYRGRLVSIKYMGLATGILFANFISFLFTSTSNWQAIFLIGLIPAIIMFIGLLIIPETPSYLSSINKKDKALEILNVLDNSNNTLETLEKGKTKASFKDLFSKSIKSALFVGIGINIFRQISGINIVTYYAPKIFLLSGFASEKLAISANLFVTIIKIICTILAIFFIDKIGRRILLMISFLGMSASIFLLSIYFLLKLNLLIIPIIALVGFSSFFSFGIGAVTWVINSEIYPNGIRGRAVGLATFFNWISNYFVSMSFLSLIGFLGNSTTFMMYSIICFIGFLFVYFKVPETKNKTFAEIQKFWK